MNEQKIDRAERYESYLNATHKLGRWLTVLVLVLLLAAPFVIGLYLGTVPNLGAAVKAFLGVGLVYLVSGIVEYLIYVPMLGAGSFGGAGGGGGARLSAPVSDSVGCSLPWPRRPPRVFPL